MYPKHPSIHTAWIMTVLHAVVAIRMELCAPVKLCLATEGDVSDGYK